MTDHVPDATEEIVIPPGYRVDEWQELATGLPLIPVKWTDYLDHAKPSIVRAIEILGDQPELWPLRDRDTR